MKTIKITTDNVISIVDVDFDNYRSIQKEIGCDLFKIVKTGKMLRYFIDPVVMLVDEEGLCKDLPANMIGCYFYDTAQHGSPIVGDIVFGVQRWADVIPPEDAMQMKEKLMKDFPFLKEV